MNLNDLFFKHQAAIGLLFNWKKDDSISEDKIDIIMRILEKDFPDEMANFIKRLLV